MKIDEAKRICPQFTPWRTDEGRVTCKNKDGDLCKLPQFFLCELITYRDRKQAKAKRGGGAALSASRLYVLDRCYRMFAFQYVYWVDRPGPEAIYFKEGDAFTVARAKVDMCKPWDGSFRKDLPPFIRAKLQAVMRFYRQYPPYTPGAITCEDSFNFEFKGAHFMGYLDGKDELRIYEWKYAMSDYDRLKIARQSAIYFKAFPNAEEFELIVFKKPALKPKKAGKPTKKNPEPQAETPDEFRERVYDHLVNSGPKNVYQRTLILRDEREIDRVLTEMIGSHAVLPVIKEHGYPPSYSMCDQGSAAGCDYKKICKEHFGKPTVEIAGVMRARQQQEREQRRARDEEAEQRANA